MTPNEQQAKRKQLEAARDRALTQLNELVKLERGQIWQTFYTQMDAIGLDKHGKAKLIV